MAFSQLPDIQTMYLEVKTYLQQYAALPLPAAQNLPPPPSVGHSPGVATTLVETYQPLETSDTVDNAKLYVQHYIPKIVGVALTFQGLFGIYRSLEFIMVEFPELEGQLAQHIITSSEINDIAVKALIQVITTILSMFFALKLTIIQSKVAQKLSTVIGILLFIGNAFIYDYFSHLNLPDTISSLFTTIFSIF